jgi:hypothetical protein
MCVDIQVFVFRVSGFRVRDIPYSSLCADFKRSWFVRLAHACARYPYSKVPVLWLFLVPSRRLSHALFGRLQGHLNAVQAVTFAK